MRTKKISFGVSRMVATEGLDKTLFVAESGWKTNQSGLKRERCPEKRLKGGSSGLGADLTAKDECKARA